MPWPKGVKRKQRTPGSGRVKGTPNKVTAKTREIFTKVLAMTAEDMERWFKECGDGIEIEKTMPDGTIVTGRLNADPGKALEVMLKLAEFSFPKLARIEKSLSELSDQELLQEVRRRRMEAERMARDPSLQAPPEAPMLMAVSEDPSPSPDGGDQEAEASDTEADTGDDEA